MLLNEPPPTQADLHFRLFGFPVRVHPLFWLVAMILGMRLPGLPGILAWVSAVFVGILVHELGHALAMRLYGFRPWITLHGLGGTASYNPTGSYGGRGNATSSQVIISAAGPAAGFLLAGLVVAGLRLAGHAFQLQWSGWADFDVQIGPLGSQPLTWFVEWLLFISVEWGLLNLLPIYPLDGGQIAREVLVAYSRDGVRQSLMLSTLTGALMVLVAITKFNDLWVALLFGYLTFNSFQTYQAYSRRGPW